jgi:uncharacterized protein
MTKHTRSTPLDPAAGYKPLDFGGEGITGSIDRDGRLIALNMRHPEHGYVTLTTAAPFPEDHRYDSNAVRAYRAGLVTLPGFGPHFNQKPTRHEALLLESAIPQIRLTFPDGGQAQITTFAHNGGALQICDCDGVALRWRGMISVQRCAYTQLTEGGPIPAVEVVTRLAVIDDVLTIENPVLGWAVALAGLPAEGVKSGEQPGAVEIDLPGKTGRTVVYYGFGPDAPAAAYHARQLAEIDAGPLLQFCLEEWAQRWENMTIDAAVRRGLVYSLLMAVPDGEGICLLTDHMLLPLSWNRDAYYAALALLHWREEMDEIVRRHLLWMFEIAERHEGTWGRCYLANGRIKDHAFQLDQQVFPLLEVADYVIKTGDQNTLNRLTPHLYTAVEMVLSHRNDTTGLFPTDETPADDPITYPYHLSSHILMWRAFTRLHQIGLGEHFASMAKAIWTAVLTHFVAEHDGHKLFGYATDGRGRHHLYHDANDIPLALAPAWGLLPADDPIWRATLDFAFSAANTGGCYDGRLGSVHSPAPWPLGDLQEIIIARAVSDPAREAKAQARLRQVAQWDGALPEAYHAATRTVFSRHWFAWPNAVLAGLELTRAL